MCFDNNVKELLLFFYFTGYVHLVWMPLSFVKKFSCFTKYAALQNEYMHHFFHIGGFAIHGSPYMWILLYHYNKDNYQVVKNCLP